MIHTKQRRLSKATRKEWPVLAKKITMLINRFRAAFMAAIFIYTFFSPAYSLVKASPSQTAADTWLPKGFTGHLIEVNGAKIYYRTGGNGPVLVLLHGFPEDGAA